MKIPAALEGLVTRFDRLSLRERLLIFAALLALVVVGWQSTFMEDLNKREKGLSAELTELQENVSRMSRASEAVALSDPRSVALARLKEEQKELDAVNAKLAAESAGLIAPAQMVEVIHDVLRHQQGLTLVALRNLPVSSLAVHAGGASGGMAVPGSAPSADDKGAAIGASAGGEQGASAGAEESAGVEQGASSLPAAGAGMGNADTRGNPQADLSAGPYLHPVEIVIEGRYLDIVAYLRALEALPYHFYWRVLELETRTYPLNRVRIELNTVSLDKEWIGV